MSFEIENYSELFEYPEKWKIVSSLFSPDHAEVQGGTIYQKWLDNNSDSHPAREILLVLDGASLFSLESRIFPATPGTIFLFDAYEKHVKSYPPNGEKSIHLWFYLLAQHIIVHFYLIENQQIGILRKSVVLENAALCSMIAQGWSDTKTSILAESFRKQKIKSLLSLLFVELLEQCASSPKQETNVEWRQEQIMLMIGRHIANTAGKGLSVEKLSQIAGYSKFHFLRTFKECTGQSVQACINAARIKKTDEMLSRGCLHKEIADELGFSSPSTFSHWLHKIHK